MVTKKLSHIGKSDVVLAIGYTLAYPITMAIFTHMRLATDVRVQDPKFHIEDPLSQPQFVHTPCIRHIYTQGHAMLTWT